MRKRAILKGLAAFSIAAAVYLGAGATTALADETPSTAPSAEVTATSAPTNTLLKASDVTIKIDYTTQRINITAPIEGEGVNKQILFGISTVSGKGDDLKLKPVTSWEVYPVEKGAIKKVNDNGEIEEDTKNGVVIDISTLNTQKENYFQIKGDVNSDPITIHIPATDKKIKMKFDPSTHTVYNNKGNEKDEAGKAYEFEYRTVYGKWEYYGTYETASKDNLEFYQQRGATLYFRQKSSGTAENEITKVTSKLKYNNKDKTPVEDVYSAPSLPGKEIKVSIGKKAAGPKVTVNYLKNTVTIPKDSQYRVGIGGSAALGTFAPAVSAKTELADVKQGGDTTLLDALLVNGGSVEAKKAGDLTKKKAESKVSHVDFPKKQEKLAVTGEKLNVAKVGVEGTQKNDITVTEVKEVKDSKGNISYTLELQNDTANKGNADFKYEIIINKEKDETKGPAIGERVKKAVAGGAKASITKLEAGDVVWIHKAGNAKTQTWATAYVKLGEITADPSPTAG